MDKFIVLVMGVTAVLFLGLVALLLVGCGTMQGDLRMEKDVKVVIDPSAYAVLGNVVVYQEVDETLIEGTVRSKFKPSHSTCHVDIKILNANGDLLQKLKAEAGGNAYRARVQSGKSRVRITRADKKGFLASTTLDVPVGSEIHLHHHSTAMKACKE